jgi:hypothetical protein
LLELKKILTVSPSVDMTVAFEAISNELFSNWIIDSGDGLFELFEIEFDFKTQDSVHSDPFVEDAKVQHEMAHWYLSSVGINLTFGTEQFAASILIRSVRSIESGNYYLGPQRCFKVLMEDAGPIETGKSGLKLVERNPVSGIEMYAIPRVLLPIEFGSQNLSERLKFGFKPYRYVRADTKDYREKYLAVLFLNKVTGRKVVLKEEGKIYTKYVQFYEKGLECNNIDLVWNVSSRMHRMSMMLGFLQRQQQRMAGSSVRRDSTW